MRQSAGGITASGSAVAVAASGRLEEWDLIEIRARVDRMEESIRDAWREMQEETRVELLEAFERLREDVDVLAAAVRGSR